VSQNFVEAMRLRCGNGACEKRWTMTLPTLPVRADFFIRMVKVQCTCPACGRTEVLIELSPEVR
jgi:hypothetical protein